MVINCYRAPAGCKGGLVARELFLRAWDNTPANTLKARDSFFAELDESGRILNYDDAVGEICRVAPDTALFQGYFDNPDANDAKYREGVYHSGDLGHILVRDGRRFLYFDGRTGYTHIHRPKSRQVIRFCAKN